MGVDIKTPPHTPPELRVNTTSYPVHNGAVDLSNQGIHSLSDIAGFHPTLNLEYLLLGSNSIRTLGGIEHLKRLRYIDVTNNPLQTIEGWGFDVEILFLARRRGYRIVEVPVIWYYGEKSKINPLRDTIRMTREVLQVRLNAWKGRYDAPRA